MYHEIKFIANAEFYNKMVCFTVLFNVFAL